MKLRAPMKRKAQQEKDENERSVRAKAARKEIHRFESLNKKQKI